MEWLEGLLEGVRFPFAYAFILGLMTAISPCPLATNITAIGYLSKDLEDRRLVLRRGAVYTLGRALAYTGLGLLFFLGANQFAISGFVQRWGEKLLGPLLVVVGLFMLDWIRFRLPAWLSFGDRLGRPQGKGFWDVLLLGFVFALAFCPYSGVLFFGMLVPMTISSASGLYLPLVFAVATGLPVLLVAWVVAYSASNVGRMFSRIKAFELWFRRAVGVLFLLVGLYYLRFLFA